MEKRWDERRYPEDFEDWIPVAEFSGNRYRVLSSPDKRFFGVIHIADNDVVAIFTQGGGYGETKFVYMHPKNIEALKRLGAAYERHM